MLPHDFTCDGRSYRMELAPRAPRSLDNRGFELVPELERAALVNEWWALGHRSLVAELHALALGRDELPSGDADDLPAQLLERLCGEGASLVLLRRMLLPIRLDPVPAAEDAERLVGIGDDEDDEHDDAADEADHWIELSFVDADGVPMAGIACTVELPTGQLRRARSSDAGIVRIEDIPRAGRCIVTFDGSAAAGLDRPTPTAPRPEPTTSSD